jgi:integrase
VPIHPQLVLWLANLPGERQGRVFLTPRGKPYGGKERGYGGQIKTAWKAACRRAGIEDLHPHDLRHTCSTWLTMAGVHEQVRDEIIGHASTSMGRRYSHVPRPELIAAIDKIPPLNLPTDKAAAAAGANVTDEQAAIWLPATEPN